VSKPPKPVTLTKRQIDNLLDALFNINEPVLPRVKMSGPVYDYAWTVWASRRDILKLQGPTALRRSKRKRVIKP
jgi:hypothetical protein